MMVIRLIMLMALFFLSPTVGSSETFLVIFIDYQKGKDIVYIDGTVTPQEKMYEALIKPFAQKGRNAEVMVLFNSNIKFSEVVNTKGIIQAVGFSSIKFYYLSSDKKKMAEIELNKHAVVVPDGFIN